MLRVVHPERDGRGTDPPKRRKGTRSPVLSLTDDETRHVRAALRATAHAYGGLDVLASVLGIPAHSLYLNARDRRPSPGLAIRLAAAAGMSVEVVLTGKLTAAGRCPTCGSRTGDRPDLLAKGGRR